MRSFLATALLFATAHLLHADAPDFSVTVAGARQQASPGGDQILPYIFLPAETSKREHMSSMPQNAKLAQSFYVIIGNKASTAYRLTMLTSDWHYSLEFEIRTVDGKTFRIGRGASVWTVNGPSSWFFQPGGVLVCVVDFVSSGWEGFPSVQELPKDQPFKIKATFRFPYGEEKKPLAFESADATAVSGRIESPPGN